MRHGSDLARQTSDAVIVRVVTPNLIIAATVIVGLNGLRLLRTNAWRQP